MAVSPQDSCPIAVVDIGSSLKRGAGLLALVLAALPTAAETLLLVGDAGEPARRGEPVLQALSAEAGRAGQGTTVVFLGDNVYPSGLPEPGTPGRPEAQRRLDAQLAATRGARAIFLPGNHDWDSGRDGGRATVQRQEAYVEGRGGSFLPERGCPGPEVLDLGPALRLIVLDTQWWLQRGDRLQHPASDCDAGSEDEVLAGLRDALEGAGGRRVVVAAHHPLASGGTHGGHFNLGHHLFPLRDWKPWLWLPLPVVGSAYPLARATGVTAQDLPSQQNRRMVGALESALARKPPLAWAAGHEHNLQVLRGRAVGYVLVSGAGVFARRSPVKRLPETLFKADAPGFMRLDVEEARPARLAVVTLDRRGRAAVRFSANLE